MAEVVKSPSPAPTTDGSGGPSSVVESPSRGHPGFWGVIEDQFALRQLISEYLIPIETNVIWYTLGGVLAIGLALEILTGIKRAGADMILTYHAPDVARWLR